MTIYTAQSGVTLAPESLLTGRPVERIEFLIVPLSAYLNGGRKGAVTVSYASPQSAARYAKVPPGKYVILARDAGNVPRKVHAFTRV